MNPLLALAISPVPALVQAGLQFHLDAGHGDSYGGSGQTWSDLSGNGQDFFRGVDGTVEGGDPTFNGAAGGKSSDEYWSLDGGDLFTFAAANEAWMDAIHEDGGACTLGLWLRTPASFSDDNGLMGTVGGAATKGFRFSITSAGQLELQIRGGGSNKLTVTADAALAAETDYLVALSFDEGAGAGGSFFARNGEYEQVASADTWDGTVVNPASGAATDTLQIGALGGGFRGMESGSRIYAAWGYDRALTKAEVDQNWEHFRRRLGL